MLRPEDWPDLMRTTHDSATSPLRVLQDPDYGTFARWFPRKKPRGIFGIFNAVRRLVCWLFSKLVEK